MNAVSSDIALFSAHQNESCFRQDFLLKYKNHTEQDEIETRENLNRLLLENVLPAHVAALFVGENKKNEVKLFEGFLFLTTIMLKLTARAEARPSFIIRSSSSSQRSHSPTVTLFFFSS